MRADTLPDACATGSLDPEDWCDALIAMVSDPRASNRDLLAAVALARRGLGAENSQGWMDNLLEFSLWETGSNPSRLDLCDHLAREGLARVDHPKRWRSYGGLLHVACEAASLEGIRWAIEREPYAARRVGGRYGLSVFHALCSREGEDDCEAAADLLALHGARADARASDGRNALFRCATGLLARKLIELGADPWAEDSQGYGPVGRWLELGLWDCASAALAARPAAVDEFLSWGSLAAREGRFPMSDRPLFIVACSRALKGTRGGAHRAGALAALGAMGADPLLLDRRGLSLYKRSQCPHALSMMEREALGRAPSALVEQERSRRL